MSRIFLLRHSHSTANAKGILAGRLENIELSKDGYLQREKLDARLQEAKFDQIFSSPLQRCRETILNFEPNPKIVDEFQEVHYGDWTGKKMRSLMRYAAWREIHKHPASVRFPNGETLPEVQTRSLLGLDQNISAKAKNVLISTHADVIKVIILHALGTHLNNIDKLQVDNASISIIEKDKSGLRVVRVNDNTSNIGDLLV